jgi:hypothetical protein
LFEVGFSIPDFLSKLPLGFLIRPMYNSASYMISIMKSTLSSEGGTFDSKRWGMVDGGDQAIICDLA